VAGPYELVVIGASWGGLVAIERVLDGLPRDFPAAVAIAQHRSPDGGSEALAGLLQSHTAMPLVDADDKQPIEPGHVYLAPPDYHLYVEEDGFALSVDEAVLHSRPSIDVLFESASDVYHDRVVGVILTGANEDGAHGLAMIKRRGGYTIVQNPVEAERSEMPRAALAAVTPDRVLSVDAIGPALRDLCGVRA
jgi:two-component system, chemotaxis family, protein-glutamate methylesterase/glutaminase